METKTNSRFIVNRQERSILVSREFEAPLPLVWRAYTESEILDQWWAPLPWKARTKKMDFAVGGYWLYAMVGPDNEKHWARVDFTAIEKHKQFTANMAFSDEEGNLNTALPISKSVNVFTKTDNGTLVEFKMFYVSEKDIQTVIDMGMEQGILACIEQLNTLFEEKKIK